MVGITLTPTSLRSSSRAHVTVTTHSGLQCLQLDCKGMYFKSTQGVWWTAIQQHTIALVQRSFVELISTW